MLTVLSLFKNIIGKLQCATSHPCIVGSCLNSSAFHSFFHSSVKFFFIFVGLILGLTRVVGMKSGARFGQNHCVRIIQEGEEEMPDTGLTARDRPSLL